MFSVDDDPDNLTPRHEVPPAAATPLDVLRKRLTLLKELSDKSKAAYDTLRREINDRTPAGSTFHPTIETGDPLDVAPLPLATVITSMPRKSLVVVDERAFGVWLVETYPDDAVTKASEPFMKHLRDLSKRVGRVCGPGGETEIPGVVMGVGERYTYVSKIDHDLIPILWGQFRDQLPRILELGD